MRNKTINEDIEQGKYQYVIIAEYWDNYNQKKIENSLRDKIKFILKYHAIPVLILDYPPLLNIQPSCGFLKNDSKDKQCFNTLESIKKYRLSRETFFHLKHEFPEIILIDPSQIICDKEKCYSSLDDTPLYSDSSDNSHLNYTGSSMVGALYIKKYGNPFKKP